MRFFYVIPRRFVSGSPKDTCTFGEKEHASKRVSIIVPDNAISKTKRATRTRPRVNLQRTSKIHQILAFLGGNFFWGPRGILCTRGAYGHLQKVGFFYFFEDTCVFGAFVLVFF